MIYINIYIYVYECLLYYNYELVLARLPQVSQEVDVKNLDLGGCVYRSKLYKIENYLRCLYLCVQQPR